MTETRLEKGFAKLKTEGRGGLVTFTVAGDPDPETAQAILEGLPAAGADIIELGMPFSDPMADGPAIQMASRRALLGGMTLRKTLDMVRKFRRNGHDTPLILMGYYNPIYRFGVEAFLREAKAAGVDGFIIVDLPPEHDDEFCIPALEAGLHFIRLVTPTTDEKRLAKVLNNSSGFVYYVSIMGITGTGAATEDQLREAMTHLKAHSSLPVAAGFGIRTPDQAARAASLADAAVVGSAIIDRLADKLDKTGRPQADLAPSVLAFVESLAMAVRKQ